MQAAQPDPRIALWMAIEHTRHQVRAFKHIVQGYLKQLKTALNQLQTLPDAEIGPPQAVPLPSPVSVPIHRQAAQRDPRIGLVRQIVCTRRDLRVNKQILRGRNVHLKQLQIMFNQLLTLPDAEIGPPHAGHTHTDIDTNWHQHKLTSTQ
jgi:hypothetical protein